MKIPEQYLERHCKLHWWNMGKKTLSFNGKLSDLLKNEKIKYSCRKTNAEHFFSFKFTNLNGITFRTRGLMSDFPHLAKQFVQMELVRMGDKSQLYVDCDWRPLVNVNF